MAIAPRCELGGTSTTDALTPAITGWTNSGVASGTAPAVGDLVFFISNSNGTSASVSQSAGTGTWNFFDTGTLNGGTVSLTTAVAYKTWTGTETAPTFTWSTGARLSWAIIAIAPDTGNTLAIDGTPLVKKDTTATTTHTASALTASGSGELSLILTGATASASGTNGLTYVAPTSWTMPPGGSSSLAGTTSIKSCGSVIWYESNVSGTVAPGAGTIEGGSSTTGTTQANLYHFLISESLSTGILPQQLVHRTLRSGYRNRPASSYR